VTWSAKPIENFKMRVLIQICLLVLVVLTTSCDKGYQIRFRNYYTEPIDSVIIGKNKVVFTQIETQTSTEYKKISSGNYDIKIVSKSKKRFTLTTFISSKGGGNKTILIDAIQQTAVLDE
jgi:hypothetical protein